jgi:hypothetical protein
MAKNPPPSAVMFTLIMGRWVSHLIYVAAKLEIADHLKHGPRTISSLIRLSSAPQSLQWTSKVPKESNRVTNPELLLSQFGQRFFGANEEMTVLVALESSGYRLLPLAVTTCILQKYTTSQVPRRVILSAIR